MQHFALTTPTGAEGGMTRIRWNFNIEAQCRLSFSAESDTSALSEVELRTSARHSCYENKYRAKRIHNTANNKP